ncbi:Vago-PB, isoform B [Yersinia kristensenii ATCC 33638]|nr:Vago-PB, isoform B [Yersinia kristensenii ATCC 33638]
MGIIFLRLIISWLIMEKPTQIIHNGSDNNYHFNRLFCRDIKKSTV